MKTITVENKITIKELKQMSKKMFGDLVKAVVDIEKEIMVVDAPMHADQEACLLDKNSDQNSLWGINLYPDKKENDFVEFDSMINIRPSQENRSRGVDDKIVRKRIIEIVNELVKK